MQFSEKYDIRRQQADDWLDIRLSSDTNLAIDPFLIWESGDDSFWGSAHDHLINFFDMVFQLVKSAGGDEDHPNWKKAADLLIFPEPAEFCLGVAEASPLGSGSNKGLQQDMLQGIKAASDVGLSQIAHMEAIALFQGGIGMDRIGDTVCNVLKTYFIEYTKQVCVRHSIPTRRQLVRNATWSSEYAQWVNQYHDLPINKVTYMRQGRFREKEIPILLTPDRFVRDIPFVSANDHWNWSWVNMASELRRDFNFDIARRVARKDKARMARLHPDSVVLYLRELEDSPKEPYPVSEDPKMLVNQKDYGIQIMDLISKPFVPESRDQFEKFVNSIAYWYQHGIEHQDSWYLLWDKARGRNERAAQVLFRNVAVNYCRAANVDLTGEANAGQGPVDFKFSAGWGSRALIEVKLVRSSKFWDGILAQQPRYQLAEGVEYGVFLAIAYTDEELAIKGKLDRAAEISSRRHGVKIHPILVDARKKESASNLRDRDAARELHGSDRKNFRKSDDAD